MRPTAMLLSIIHSEGRIISLETKNRIIKAPYPIIKLTPIILNIPNFLRLIKTTIASVRMMAVVITSSYEPAADFLRAT